MRIDKIVDEVSERKPPKSISPFALTVYGLLVVVAFAALGFLWPLAKEAATK